MSPTILYAGSAASGSGPNGAWTNPGNATGAPDQVYASGNISGAGSQTNSLLLTNYGFNLPPSAVIDGIFVNFGRDGTNAGTLSVQLLKAGSPTGAAKTNTATWTGSELFEGNGGTSDLWGATFTPSDINSSGFGVAIQAYNTHSGGTAFIDSAAIYVYWHTAPTTVFKEYIYKSFDSSSNYLGLLPTPSSDIAISQDINSAGANNVTITIPKSADTSYRAVDNLTDESGNLLTDEGLDQLTDEGQIPIFLPGSSSETALIKTGNIVSIRVVNYWHPQGKLIFVGIMERVEATFGGDAQDDSIVITAYSFGEDLNNYMLRASPYTYTADVFQSASNVFATISSAGPPLNSYNYYGQSWKVGAGVTNLGAINLALLGSANVTISVYADPGFSVLLGWSKQTGINVSTETTIQFSFANELVITPGSTLYFAVTVDPGQSIQIATQNTAVYANGTMYNANYGGGAGGGNYVAVTGDLYFETFSGTGSTTATITNTDPTTMLEEFMNDYLARGGAISYNSSTVQMTGLSLTAGFNSNTIYEGIQEVLTLAPSGFYFYVDTGTNLLYFQAANTVADVVLTKGLHMNQVKIVETIEYVINTIFFTGGPDPGNAGFNIYTTDSDVVSTTKYRPRLDRPTDSHVTDKTTAHTISQEEIATHKNESNQSVVTVLDRVIDIHSLHVGQVVGFNGFGNFADSLLVQIVRIDWRAEQATLTLGILPKKIQATIEQNVKSLVALNTISTNTNPATPS